MKEKAARKKYDVIVIGGGASGLFCTAALLEKKRSVLILEPNRFLGRKLRITGKGRCNLTNDCSADEVMKNVPRNPKFLCSALNSFGPSDIKNWFEAAGVPLKTERGRRVFPVSDRATDVAEALIRACSCADIRHEKAVEILTEDNKISGIRTDKSIYYADSAVMSTGGCSYPLTGSDGSGYALVRALGHTVIAPQPSLVPLKTLKIYPNLSGLALKNVALSLYDLENLKKPLFKDLGELTFESYGISGPLALSASCYIDDEKLKRKAYELYVDLKPGLTSNQVESRILRDIASAPLETIDKLLRGLLPSALSEVFINLLSLDKTAKVCNMTRNTRRSIIELLKHFSLTPIAKRGFDEAIITRGGISTKEIDPRGMESRLVKGLYFTGEIIDCDALTGGYNLTIAFSTAHSAASEIIRQIKENENGNKLCR